MGRHVSGACWTRFKSSWGGAGSGGHGGKWNSETPGSYSLGSKLNKRFRVSHNRKTTRIGDLKQDLQRASKCGLPMEAQSCSLHVSCSLWEAWITFQMVAWDLESLPEPGMSRVLYYLHHPQERITRASLVAQWLRVHLPTQETPDPSRSGTILYSAEQLSPWATTIEPVLHSPGAPTREASSVRSLCTTARE